MLHDMLDDMSGFYDEEDMARFATQAPAVSLTRLGVIERSSATRNRSSFWSRHSTRILAKRDAAALASRNSGGSITLDCPDGGSFTYTAAGMRDNNCAESEELAGGDYEKWVDDGFISLKGDVKIGYEAAFRLTLDLKTRYDILENGEREREELYMKGSVLYAYSPIDADIPDRTLVEIEKFDYASKGEDNCGRWDFHIWYRDYVEKRENLGIQRTVKYSGMIGGTGTGVGLGGMLEVSTDEVLRYDDSAAEFPRGDVVMKGADGSELRVKFSEDGAQATIELDEDVIAGPFTYQEEFEDWLERDNDC
jgi:hypothetical protein